MKKSRSYEGYKIQHCLIMRTNISSPMTQNSGILKETDQKISRWIGQINSIPRRSAVCKWGQKAENKPSGLTLHPDAASAGTQGPLPCRGTQLVSHPAPTGPESPQRSQIAEPVTLPISGAGARRRPQRGRLVANQFRSNQAASVLQIRLSQRRFSVFG